MTPERFRRLTESYGADPEHWPQAERTGAEALLALRNPDALAALAEARALDAELSMSIFAAPDREWVRAIVASAPSSGSGSGSLRPKPSWKRPVWWLSGAGFVGAGAAGIATGVLAISLTAPLPGAFSGPPSIFDQNDAGTVFNSATPYWSDQ